MDNSEGESSLRYAGIICSQTGEKLGTIEEESLFGSRSKPIRSCEGTPKKSATFHGLADIHFTDPVSSSPYNSDQHLKSSLRRGRKRSILYEMGERIRLFSTGSFVSTVPMSLPKSQSLNSFKDADSEVLLSCSKKSRCNGSGSTTSLPKKHELSFDMSLEVDGGATQLGMLCKQCSVADLTCPKAQQELQSPSVPSLYSLAPSDLSSNEPLCRICHCCWPSDPSDPLISPCRCSGSLQYVHVSCLMHWLDISSRKLHRPAICELCLYKYRRRRVLKYREIKLPKCADKDLRYYALFLFAFLLMVLSAAATILCFQLEKKYNESANRTVSATNSPSEPQLAIDLSSIPSGTDQTRKEMENLLSTVTLVAAIVFFFSFFMAMYSHVKSGLSVCNYIALCWSSNLEWSIEEYKQARDSQYLTKLEEIRRKLNEKQRKSREEVQPLRSSVIVIE